MNCCTKISDTTDPIPNINDEAPTVMFCCDYADCNAEFETETQLENHLIMHMDQRRYQCKTCNKIFVVRINYQSHICTPQNKIISPPPLYLNTQ